jgi:hypothetical protein
VMFGQNNDLSFLSNIKCPSGRMRINHGYSH